MNVTREFIEANWPLSEVVLKEMPAQGAAGQVGIVVAKEGKYTYKIAARWKTAVNLERDLGAYGFLNQKGFKYISKLLNTKNNKTFVEYENKLIYLIKFIEGEHPVWTPSTFENLGKITAALHSIKDFPFESDYKPSAAIPQLIEKAEKYAFKHEFLEVLKTIRSFDSLTKTLIHTEITPGNVIQKPDGSIVVIDWDEVGIGPAVLDLGVSLINHFVTEDLEILEGNAKAYYESYFALRPMNVEEKGYIFDAAIFWACSWVTYGDTKKRWKRIQWAMKNRVLLESLFI